MRTPQTSRGHESIRRMRAARWLVPAGLLALAPAAAAGLVALEPVLVEGRVLMKAEPQGAYKAPVAILWLKLDAGSADRALASRIAQGPFRDLADFARRAGLTAEREAQLRAGAAAILAAGPLARE